MRPFEFLLIGCLVFLSAFLSAAEVSLFSLSRFQLRYLKDHFRTIYMQIKRLLHDPSGLLVTILVSNEIINISLATTIEKIVLRNWDDLPSESFVGWARTYLGGLPAWLAQMTVGVIITLPIVLILCEMTPKVLAARANQIVAPLTTTTLHWLHKLLTPFRILISKVLGLLIGKKMRKKAELLRGGSREPLIKEEEFLFMIEEGHREGIVHSSELELIRNIFELDDTKSEDVCTPLPKTFSLPARASVKQALEAYRAKPLSRIPVHGNNKNTIVGVLYAKDLIPARLDPAGQGASVESLMRRPLFVRQGTRLNALFRSMRQNHTHMAVIVDAGDQAIGVVTMSDLLTEIFGEFFEGTQGTAGAKR